MTDGIRLACRCDEVQLQVERAPIVATECYCTSCRTAGARLHKLANAPPVLQADGGTRFVLYRKDRVRFLKGADRLAEFRLTPQSPTRRVVATCCNTPVFLEFNRGHWLSLYGNLWPAGALPPIELRTMTVDLPDASVLGTDVPRAGRQSLSFFAKLLGAWIAMGFRAPEIKAVQRTLAVPEA